MFPNNNVLQLIGITKQLLISFSSFKESLLEESINNAENIPAPAPPGTVRLGNTMIPITIPNKFAFGAHGFATRII